MVHYCKAEAKPLVTQSVVENFFTRQVEKGLIGYGDRAHVERTGTKFVVRDIDTLWRRLQRVAKRLQEIESRLTSDQEQDVNQPVKVDSGTAAPVKQQPGRMTRSKAKELGVTLHAPDLTGKVQVIAKDQDVACGQSSRDARGSSCSIESVPDRSPGLQSQASPVLSDAGNSGMDDHVSRTPDESMQSTGRRSSHAEHSQPSDHTDSEHSYQPFEELQAGNVDSMMRGTPRSDIVESERTTEPANRRLKRTNSLSQLSFQLDWDYHDEGHGFDRPNSDVVKGLARNIASPRQSPRSEYLSVKPSSVADLTNTERSPMGSQVSPRSVDARMKARSPTSPLTQPEADVERSRTERDLSVCVNERRRSANTLDVLSTGDDPTSPETGNGTPTTFKNASGRHEPAKGKQNGKLAGRRGSKTNRESPERQNANSDPSSYAKKKASIVYLEVYAVAQLFNLWAADTWKVISGSSRRERQNEVKQSMIHIAVDKHHDFQVRRLILDHWESWVETAQQCLANGVTVEDLVKGLPESLYIDSLCGGTFNCSNLRTPRTLGFPRGRSDPTANQIDSVPPALLPPEQPSILTRLDGQNWSTPAVQAIKLQYGSLGKDLIPVDKAPNLLSGVNGNNPTGHTELNDSITLLKQQIGDQSRREADLLSEVNDIQRRHAEELELQRTEIEALREKREEEGARSAQLLSLSEHLKLVAETDRVSHQSQVDSLMRENEDLRKRLQDQQAEAQQRLIKLEQSAQDQISSICDQHKADYLALARELDDVRKAQVHQQTSREPLEIESSSDEGEVDIESVEGSDNLLDLDRAAAEQLRNARDQEVTPLEPASRTEDPRNVNGEKVEVPKAVGGNYDHFLTREQCKRELGLMTQALTTLAEEHGTSVQKETGAYLVETPHDLSKDSYEAHMSQGGYQPEAAIAGGKASHSPSVNPPENGRPGRQRSRQLDQSAGMNLEGIGNAHNWNPSQRSANVLDTNHTSTPMSYAGTQSTAKPVPVTTQSCAGSGTTEVHDGHVSTRKFQNASSGAGTAADIRIHRGVASLPPVCVGTQSTYVLPAAIITATTQSTSTTATAATSSAYHRNRGRSHESTGESRQYNRGGGGTGMRNSRDTGSGTEQNRGHDSPPHERDSPDRNAGNWNQGNQGGGGGDEPGGDDNGSGRRGDKRRNRRADENDDDDESAGGPSGRGHETLYPSPALEMFKGMFDSINQTFRKPADRDDVLSYQEVQKSLPKFSAPTTARSWEQYLRRVEKALRDNNIPRHRWASLLYSKLEGEAEKAVAGLSEAALDDWDDLVGALNKKFVKPRDREQAHVLLEQRVQGKEESVEQFGNALADLALKAFPNQPERMRTEVTRRLQVGLILPASRSRLKDFLRSAESWPRPPTMEDILDELIEHDPSVDPMGKFTGNEQFSVNVVQNAVPPPNANAGANNSNAGAGEAFAVRNQSGNAQPGKNWSRNQKKRAKLKAKGGGGQQQQQNNQQAANQRSEGQNKAANQNFQNSSNQQPGNSANLFSDKVLDQLAQKIMSKLNQFSGRGGQAPNSGPRRNDGKNQFAGNKPGYSGFKKQANGQSRSRACHRCGRLGHWKRQCTAKIGHVLCIDCESHDPACEGNCPEAALYLSSGEDDPEN